MQLSRKESLNNNNNNNNLKEKKKKKQIPRENRDIMKTGNAEP